jgi:hypothetical protein
MRTGERHHWCCHAAGVCALVQQEGGDGLPSSASQPCWWADRCLDDDDGRVGNGQAHTAC